MYATDLASSKADCWVCCVKMDCSDVEVPVKVSRCPVTGDWDEPWTAWALGWLDEDVWER